MKVLNIHERFLKNGKMAGKLIDLLASRDDRLWPRSWPPMKFDRPLGVGAAGGHGPVRYVVCEYVPARSICFAFTGPSGFNGGHRLDLIDHRDGEILRHTLEMDATGIALLTWPLFFRPLHDALIEDALAQAEAETGLAPRVAAWSWYVRLIRRLAGAGKRRQHVPRLREIAHV
jgi:hypothetical protein